MSNASACYDEKCVISIAAAGLKTEYIFGMYTYDSHTFDGIPE